MIVVGTFFDRIKLCKEKYFEKLKEDIEGMYTFGNRDQPFKGMDPNLFCAVSCITRDGNLIAIDDTTDFKAVG